MSHRLYFPNEFSNVVPLWNKLYLVVPTDDGSENANFLSIKCPSVCTPTELINYSIKAELILLQSLSIEHGVVSENIHARHLPNGGHFCFRPLPSWNFQEHY